MGAGKSWELEFNKCQAGNIYKLKGSWTFVKKLELELVRPAVKFTNCKKLHFAASFFIIDQYHNLWYNKIRVFFKYK